jgi:hypothetical protein
MLLFLQLNIQHSRRLLTKVPVMALSLLLAISACDDSSDLYNLKDPSPETITGQEATQASPAPSDSQETPEPTNSAVPEEWLISAEGIGEAKLGIKLGDLKETLGPEAEFTEEPEFMPDFDAIAIRKDGDVYYYVLYLADDVFTDDDVIQGLVTTNPQFLTAEEIGPGSTIQEAEAVYGDTTLSYHVMNESREYVRFDRHPARNISFNTGKATQSLAGIYTTPGGDYNETSQFKDDATIQSVLVVCLGEDCAG